MHGSDDWLKRKEGRNALHNKELAHLKTSEVDISSGETQDEHPHGIKFESFPK